MHFYCKFKLYHKSLRKQNCLVKNNLTSNLAVRCASTIVHNRQGTRKSTIFFLTTPAQAARVVNEKVSTKALFSFVLFLILHPSTVRYRTEYRTDLQQSWTLKNWRNCSPKLPKLGSAVKVLPGERRRLYTQLRPQTIRNYSLLWRNYQ